MSKCGAIIDFAETGQIRYSKVREASHYLKLNQVSESFLMAFTEAMRAKPRIHSVASFDHTYREEYPEDTIPSTKTLYIYIHQGLLDVKPIDLPKAVRIRKRKKVRPSTKKHLGTSIEERPEEINNCSTFGHWESDLVLGKKTKGEAVVMTLVERQTRFALACKLPNKQAETIHQSVKDLLSQYPICSITSDNGSEFSLLSHLAGVDIYYAHPYSSHERGSNENFNGLLREFLPKGKSLNPLTDDELSQYVSAINERPRRLLNYKTATFLFGVTQTV